MALTLATLLQSIILLTLFLHALTTLLTDTPLSFQGLVDPRALPSPSDDYSLALFKLGTACLSSTRLSGLDADLIDITTASETWVEVRGSSVVVREVDGSIALPDAGIVGGLGVMFAYLDTVVFLPAMLRGLVPPAKEAKHELESLKPGRIDEKTIGRFLDEPDMPDVDLFLRSSGEQRTSNFLLWQSAYAEFVFLDTLFPDFDRRDLWRACEIYAGRERRHGGAVDRAEATDADAIAADTTDDATDDSDTDPGVET